MSDRTDAQGAANAKRYVAVAFYPHHVEHLAPLCEMLGMPLVVCDSAGQSAAVGCYPRLDPIWMRNLKIPDGIDRVLACLRELRAEVIFYSDLIDRGTLQRYFRRHDPAPRIVHCPHGFSEKRHLWSRELAYQDVALVLGRHAVDQLEAMGVERAECTPVLAGNLRRRYYEAHRPFFLQQRAEWGVAQDLGRRTMLYAPTWDDRIGTSSFFSAFATLTQNLPDGWRLIVKMHPHLEKKSALVSALLAACAGRDDVSIVRNCPLVHPFLDAADVFIGDMSAVAYDFLGYDRPMFFLNQPAGTDRDPGESLLFQCGTSIPPARYADVYAIVGRELETDAERFSARRTAVDAYTHAKAMPATTLRATIAAAVAGDAPAWMQAPPTGAARLSAP